jgi:hypothetical protein
MFSLVPLLETATMIPMPIDAGQDPQFPKCGQKATKQDARNADSSPACARAMPCLASFRAQHRDQEGELR